MKYENTEVKEDESKELECFKRIKNLLVCTDYEKDIVKSVSERRIKNAKIKTLRTG